MIAAGPDRDPAAHVETQVVHRGDALVIALALVDPRPDELAVREPQIDAVRHVEPACEPLGTRLRVVDLDQHRDAELTGAAEEIVVRLDLVPDVALADDALRPDHLLDLVTDGEPVLEQKRQVLADVDPPRLLGGENGGAEGGPLVLVGGIVDDLLARDRTGHQPPSSVRTALTGVGKPSARYARARIDIGCIGATPACCRNWSAASGQSVAHARASAERIPSNARAPIRAEAAKPSTVIAYVPSCPQHSSTVSGCTPGILRSRSRPLKPIPCARRWHGAWYATGPFGVLWKSVENRGSFRIDHRNSLGSMTAAATRAAASRSSGATSVGCSRRIIIEHVGLIARTLAPRSTNGRRWRRFTFTCARSVARSPRSQAGMPQQRSPATQRRSTWLRSITATVSRPISGSLFCT